MTGYVASRYNVRSVDPRGRALYANTRSGTVVDVDEFVDAALAATSPHRIDELDMTVREGLAQLGFLTGAGTDEAREVREAFARDRADPGLELTVSPTVACNLRCTYCFEADHPIRYLDDGERRAITTLARRHLDDGAPSFHVTWFGGEPLLHLEGLLALSRDFIRLATFRGVPYSASIITNGTLLSPDVAELLRRHRVTDAQISLDGPQMTHDQLRVDAIGRGSYERVIAGVESAARHLTVKLRIHIDRTNYRYVPRLLHDLADRHLTGVALGFVRIEPPTLYRRTAVATPRRFLTVPEFAAHEVEWLALAAELGFAVSHALPAPAMMVPCAAVNANHFAVEPGGRVKRCWIDVADDGTSSGSLTSDGTVELHGGDAVWRAYQPFDLGCDECSFLPMCMGGCPKARVSGALAADLSEHHRVAYKESYVCTPRKFNLGALMAQGLVR